MESNTHDTTSVSSALEVFSTTMRYINRHYLSISAGLHGLDQRQHRYEPFEAVDMRQGQNALGSYRCSVGWATMQTMMFTSVDCTRRTV